MLSKVEVVEYVFKVIGVVIVGLYGLSTGTEMLQWLTKWLKSDSEGMHL